MSLFEKGKKSVEKLQGNVEALKYKIYQIENEIYRYRKSRLFDDLARSKFQDKMRQVIAKRPTQLPGPPGTTNPRFPAMSKAEIRFLERPMTGKTWLKRWVIDLPDM